jgi:transposase InsO family protein
LLGRETGGEHSSQQECDDNIKTTGASSHGPLRTVAYLSIEGSKYGLVIVDDFSRFTWTFFL